MAKAWIGLYGKFAVDFDCNDYFRIVRRLPDGRYLAQTTTPLVTFGAIDAIYKESELLGPCCELYLSEQDLLVNERYR
jgi:hypothetical protein